MIKRAWVWLEARALWIFAVGLTLASSGIDGRYMAAWMSPGAGWLGYVLNTTADVAGMVIAHEFARLQQDKSRLKRRLSVVLLGSEVVAVLYSWFFSWRQLLIVMPMSEPEAYRWVAPIAAGFIPALLAFIGFANGLIAGRLETTEKPVVTSGKPLARQPEQVAQPRKLTVSEWRAIRATLNGDGPATVDQLNQWLTAHNYEAVPVTTGRRWLSTHTHEVSNGN